MRTILGAVLAMLSLAGQASAQDGYEWSVQADPEGGGAQAIGCLPGEFEQIFTSLCVYVGCEAGAAPELGLGLQQVPLPAETPVRIAVDGRAVAELSLSVPPGLPGGAIPLAGQDSLLEALRTGRVARVSLGAVEGWRDYELPLSGAGEAIDAALAACSSPAFEPVTGGLGQEAAGRASDDPAGEAIAENEAFCAGGAMAVGPGFVRQVDVDGDRVNDVLIDWAGLTCDGSRAFCGSGGCTQEIWLSDPAGPYRLLLEDFVERIDLTAPGQVRVLRDGAQCGRSGAENCEQDYRVEDGALRPLD